MFGCSDDEDSNEPCPDQPQLTTFEVSNINYDDNTDLSSATFSAEINNIQLGINCEIVSITNQGFVYGNSIQPTTSDNVINVNGENFSYIFNDLPSETTFYVRVYLTNALGTFYGNEVNFTTPQSTNPVYLSSNGITIKARNWAEAGMSGEINGVTYTIVDINTLTSMIYNEEDVTVLCTSKITSMYQMFYGSQFNQDISSWDISNVADMQRMFFNSQFNQDISNWDVSNVTNMGGMFAYSQFNQDISNWDVSSVINMSGNAVSGGMFQSSQFNQDISNWDVSNVTDMSGMFINNLYFNQDIGNWDVSSVTNMEQMFANSHFNQDIGNWEVSNVTNMYSLFYGSQFNKDISSWDVSNITDMTALFINSQFNQDISNWDVSNVTNMGAMFAISQFNQNLSNWDVSNVTECSEFSDDTPQWTLPQPNFTNCNPD